MTLELVSMPVRQGRAQLAIELFKQLNWLELPPGEFEGATAVMDGKTTLAFVERPCDTHDPQTIIRGFPNLLFLKQVLTRWAQHHQVNLQIEKHEASILAVSIADIFQQPIHFIP